MKLKELQEELTRIEPKIDFLHEVCGCGLYAEITQTSDGYFLGRRKGTCGFDNFLGKTFRERTNSYTKVLKSNDR